MSALPSPLDPADLAADLSALRRALHRRPEVGFDEHETSAALKAWFTERGFAVGPPLAGTGFAVEVEGTAPGAGSGPAVGYRADMDALPVDEATEAVYRSETPGVMHACGHDGHMAIAAGVALHARARRAEMHGRVRVFFQPNEERTPSGAPVMIREGVLDGLSAVYAVHVDPGLPVGRFGLRAGAITAACAPFVVTVASGQSGHSARPHEAVDTVWVATQIANDLYQLAGRVTDARKPAVLTLCRFQAGDALNVVPASVEFGGTLRCVDSETLAFLREKIRRVAGALGAVYNADVEVAFSHTLPAVVNTVAEVGRARAAVADALGAGAAIDLPLPSMGGEDFAYYLEHVPGAMVRAGSAGGISTRYPLHHARFDLDEGVLPLAAGVMADVCLRDLAERQRA